MMESAVQLLAAEVREGFQQELNRLAKENWNNKQLLGELAKTALSIQEQFTDNMKRVEDILRSHEWLLKTGNEIKDRLSDVPGELAEQGVEIQKLQAEIKRLDEENKQLREQFAEDLELAQDDAATEVAEVRSVLRGLLAKFGYRSPPNDVQQPPPARGPEPPSVSAQALHARAPPPPQRHADDLEVGMDMD